MRKIDSFLSEYGESHQNPTNKLIHWICVPLIYWSILGLLYSIPTMALLENIDVSINKVIYNWATLAMIFVFVYYLSLSKSLAFAMLLFSAFCIYVASLVDVLFNWSLWSISLGVFILAWIGQFFGHKIEGKKPSFFKDLQFLLIGPAWLMHFVFKKIGLKY